MGIELEYKLAVANPAQLEQILFDPQVKEVQVGDYQIFEMATIYYDTPDRRLGTLRWTLRLRQENNQLVATLKTPYQGKMRGEWSCEAANIQEAVPVLLETGAPEELDGAAERPDAGAGLRGPVYPAGGQSALCRRVGLRAGRRRGPAGRRRQGGGPL